MDRFINYIYCYRILPLVTTTIDIAHLYCVEGMSQSRSAGSEEMSVVIVNIVVLMQLIEKI